MTNSRTVRFRTCPTTSMVAAIMVLGFTLSSSGQEPWSGADPPELSQLLTEFESASFFLDQLEIGEKIVNLGDSRAGTTLEALLESEDRHVRGNAAYVLARLGEPLGYEALVSILGDFSHRGPGQGFFGSGRCSTREDCEAVSRRQTITDRYYAVHLLGKLRDPRAFDVLVPLLSDRTVNYKVAWALGQIGDPRAVEELIPWLSDPEAFLRVSAIHALVQLEAVEVIPLLRGLLDDTVIPRTGKHVPVAQTAREAIGELERNQPK